MTTGQVILATLVVLLGAGGTYLLLPHAHGATRPRIVHAVGAILAGLALLGFMTFWTPPGPFISGLFFYLFSIAAVVGALLTVTSRNPIYSALWFASVVLSTAGLFLLAGAPVPGGRDDHRLRRGDHRHVPVRDHAGPDGRQGRLRPGRPRTRPRRPSRASCSSGACSTASRPWPVDRDPLGYHLRNQQSGEKNLVRASNMLTYYNLTERSSIAAVLDQAVRPTSSLTDAGGAEKPNVAGLGEALYTDHLVTVELAGGLLFVALIAAVAITNPRRPVRPEVGAPVAGPAR